MNWFQRLSQSGRMEKELDNELRFHFESQVADKIRAGMSEAEARRTTRLEFGGLDQVKEDCRESRGTLWLASIVQDLRFGMRILARSPGFSFTAILVLALGIGVSTLAFSLYNLIALQSIPVRDPATLVNIERQSPENRAPGVPYVSIAYYRDNAKSLSAVMATMRSTPMALNQDEQRINPDFVTANYFTELGASAALGRLFDPGREDSPASSPVAVLSFRLWQRKFSSDPSIIGKTIYLAGKPATVIGVTSQTFANLGAEDPDAWLPLVQHSYFVEGSKSLSDPAFDGMILMWGHLAPGVSPANAEQELLSLTNQLRKLYPAMIWDQERIVITPGAHFFSLEDGAPVLALVALLVLLILAVACANLGGLLMARGVTRRQEIQLRLDLGARRSRVFRQLLTESLLLGFLGSIAALPLSYIALRLALHYANAPAWMSALPDWRVLVFTAAMGLLAALFFGLLPILQMVRRKKKRILWQQFVVCAQVGASCVLLILAGLLVRATLHTIYTDPGFGYEQVLAIDPGLNDHGYTSAKAQSYLDQLQGRLRSVPGVISVSMAQIPPLVNSTDVMIQGFHIDGHVIETYPNWVGPEFFQTMSIPLLRGRYMRAGETHVVMLSESLARKRWLTGDPIGKEWGTGKDIVVGIVGNTRAMDLSNSDATEIYYPPSAESLPNMSVLIRTAGAPDGLSPTLKKIAVSIDPRLFPALTPLKAGFIKSIGQVEQIATIISLLGSIAIFLAVVGLLGLVTYAVSQRTKEIAIRLALGASHTEIFSAVLHRFAWPVLIGLVAGVAMTAGLSQILRRGLYGISGLDPISYFGAMTLLIAVLATAALLPIRRAFRIDIASILHSD
jgi:predicted permease